MKRKSLLPALVLLLLSSSALGQVVRREGEFGDKIYGDISRAGELDMYVANAVKGSTMTVSLGPRGKTPYRASFFREDGKLDGGLEIVAPGNDFGSLLGNVFLKKNGRAVKTTPTALSETGPYRVLVSSPSDDAGNPFTGEYALRVRVRPPKRLALSGTYDGSGMRDVEFDVLAGSLVNVTLKAGPGSPLPEITDLLDPDGESLLGGLTIKVKKKSAQVKKALLEKFGTHRLRIHADGGGAWRATLKIRAAKRKAAVVENLDPVPPPEDPIVLSTGLGEPIVTLVDEVGGANSFQALPRSFIPGQKTPQSIFFGLDGTTPSCSETLPVAMSLSDGEPWVQVRAEVGGPNTFTFRPGRTAPAWWVNGTSTPTDPVYDEDVLVGFSIHVNKTGYAATVSDITYTDDEDAFVTSFTAEVTTPDGTGRSVIGSVVRNVEGDVVAYTDDRTWYHEEGDRSYAVAIRETTREEGAAVSYLVDYAGPEGPHEPIPYPPVDEAGRLIYYVMSCTTGYRALFRDIAYTYDAGLDLDLLTDATIEVETPDGDGTTVLEDIVRDAEGRLAGWTETRTYGASGAVYTLEFHDLRRAEVNGGGFRAGEVNGYRVALTGPGGPLGTFTLPLWRLSEEEEDALGE